MINDLPDVVRWSVCLLFADDLKLVRTIGDRSDCLKLQEDIDRVVAWSIQNRLYFNAAKCQVMSFSRSRSPCHHEYLVDGVRIQRVDEVRDLGVRFTVNLNFREHIISICKKSYRNLRIYYAPVERVH